MVGCVYLHLKTQFRFISILEITSEVATSPDKPRNDKPEKSVPFPVANVKEQSLPSTSGAPKRSSSMECNCDTKIPCSGNSMGSSASDSSIRTQVILLLKMVKLSYIVEIGGAGFCQNFKKYALCIINNAT